MPKILQAEDVLNGAEGTATAVLDGRVIELFEVRNLTATVDLDKQDVRTLGNRATQKKVTGWSGTGSMEVYMVTSRWSRQMIDYIKTGKIRKFDINVKNEDPSTSIGRQVTKVSGCIIDGVDIAKLDVDNSTLTQSVNFTFEDADILEEFTEI